MYVISAVQVAAQVAAPGVRECSCQANLLILEQQSTVHTLMFVTLILLSLFISILHNGSECCNRIIFIIFSEKGFLL